MANDDEVAEDEGFEIIASKRDIWPQNVEYHFITLMEEEVKKGNRQTTTLTKSAWKQIREALKTKFGKEYSMEQFKNKYNQLRGRWKDFTNVIKMETGLGYNSATGQIIASDDEWKKLCEKYKSAKQFKRKCCFHYDKSCVIFGDTTASSVNQHPSTRSPSISNDDDSEGDNDFDHEEHSQPTKKKENIGSDTKKRKAREQVQMAFVNALTIIGESAKRKADILEKMSTNQVVGTGVTREVDGQDEEKKKLLTCLSILDTLEGIGAAPFTKAVKILKEDPGWRDVFLALSDERKKDVVLNL